MGIGAIFIAMNRVLIALIRSGGHVDISPYNIAILTPNYFENGFIRRGLGGSILYLLDGGTSLHRISSGAAFQLLGAVFLALPMTLLLRRLALRGDPMWRWFALLMLLSPQLFWGWGRDIGRGDMLICGAIAWSVIAALNGRYVLAAVIVALGSLAHETAVIFGGPMLVGLWFLALRQGKARIGHGVAAISVLAILLAAAALAQWRFGDDLAAIAQTVRGGRVLAEHARVYDIATYLTWGGWPAIPSSWCMTFSNDAVPYVIASCFIVLLVNFRILFDRSWQLKCLFGFTALIPMIFMSAVAFDYGRWTMFAVANAWLAAVAFRLQAGEIMLPGRRDIQINIGLLLALIIMGPASSHHPSMVVKKIERLLWKSSSEKWLSDCTPNWAASLGPAENDLDEAFRRDPQRN